MNKSKLVLSVPALHKLPNSMSMLYTIILIHGVNNKVGAEEPLQLLLHTLSLHSLSDSVVCVQKRDVAWIIAEHLNRNVNGKFEGKMK